MSIEALTLAQLYAPSFPTGAFAYSSGLEAAIAQGAVRDASGLRAWIAGVLVHGAGHTDAALLGAAYRGADWQELDVLADALCASAERVLEARAQGTAFAQAAARVFAIDLPRTHYPVAAGIAARALALPLDLTARFHAQALAQALASVAVRLVPLGATEAQAVVAALAPEIAAAAEEAQDGLDALGACAFAADIASMRHETLQTRLFRT